MRYVLFFCLVIASLSGYGSVDTIAYHYPDKVFLFLCESPEHYIQATEYLIDENRKTAAVDMYGRLKGYVSDTNEGLKTHYLLLTEQINNMGNEATAKKLLYQDSKIPSSIIFINDFTGVYNPNMSTTQNAIAYGDNRYAGASTVQPLSAGDYLIRAGNNRNKSVIFGVVGVSVSSLLFAIYANNNTDALLYLAAGTGAIGLTASFAFSIKANKDLKRAGKTMNGF